MNKREHEENISILKSIIPEYEMRNNTFGVNALRDAISALEKQIPKKPKKLTYKPLLDFGWRYECPNCKCACGENIYHEEITSDQIFCTQCGQAIDWSDEDE